MADSRRFAETNDTLERQALIAQVEAAIRA
jgi:hypothetical protein